MFKFVKFEKAKDKYTELIFRGGNDTLVVSYFSPMNVVSIESELESGINALIASQPPEINCFELTELKFYNLVHNSNQINAIRDQVQRKIKEEYPDYGSELAMIKLPKINLKRIKYEKYINDCIKFGKKEKAKLGYIK